MWRWDRPELPAETGHEHRERPKCDLRDWEAHRRTRYFDADSGQIVREDHEAIRARFRPDPSRLLRSGAAREPHPFISILLGACTHGAVWWMGMSMLAFGPSPWWVTVPAIGVPLVLGWKFALVHVLVVWVLGSLFIAFDGWAGWILMLPLAGLIAPGKWIPNQW